MENKKKVAFYTLGCKLNFSETSTIARDFQNEGFERVDFEEIADIYVINTCSVTENADKQFKQIVKKAMKLNDKAFVAAVGCYAQLKPEDLAAVDGVDLVLGATEKFKITDYINDLSKNDMGEIHSCEIEEADFYVGSYSIGDRTRAFLKVQDGCDYKCTYCTIPLARGISRSDALENVLNTIENIRTKNEQLITIVGCGGDRDKTKRPVMANIASALSDKVIFTSDNPRTENPDTIIAEMEKGVESQNFKKTISISDRKQAIKTACQLATENDIILIAGKGHETYQEINGVRQDFDDMLIVKEMLNQLNK